MAERKPYRRSEAAVSALVALEALAATPNLAALHRPMALDEQAREAYVQRISEEEQRRRDRLTRQITAEAAPIPMLIVEPDKCAKPNQQRRRSR